MADLIHEQMAPLAWDSDGMPFQWPSGTVALKIRVYTGQRGRPPNYWDEHGPAHLPPDATMADLRTKVKNESGDYRLYPVSATGEELEPVACIKLVPVAEGERLTVIGDDSGPLRPPAAPPAMPVREPTPGVESYRSPPRAGSARHGAHMHRGGVDLTFMFSRFMDQQEKRDAQLTQMMQTLVESTASVQRSTAEMIQVNNSTMQVARGLDALARLPAPRDIDEELLAEKLAELIDLEEPETNQEPEKPGQGSRLGAFMNGPIGAMLAGLAGGLAKGINKAVDAKAQAAVAASRAEEARADAVRAQAQAVQAKADRVKEAAEAGWFDDDDDSKEIHEEAIAEEPQTVPPSRPVQATAPTKPSTAPAHRHGGPRLRRVSPIEATQPESSPEVAQGPPTADPDKPVSTTDTAKRLTGERIAPEASNHSDDRHDE